MTSTRRDLVKRGIFLGAATVGAWGGPGALLRTLRAGQVDGGPRNLVFVELDGGNDGLNTIVPHALDGGVYSSLYRPSLAIPAETLIPIDDSLGFNPRLSPLLPIWEAGKLAVVQGVGSPLPTFSHEFAKQVWASGDPDGSADASTGWFGRYLKNLPTAKSRAFDVARFADPMFAGAKQFVPAFPGLGSLKFPVDGKHPDDGWARKQAFVAIHAMLAAADGADPHDALTEIAATGGKLVEVIEDYSDVKSVSHAGGYPSHALGDALKLVVTLLKAKLGLRYHHVVFEGFDTHAAQNDSSGSSHDEKLETLARALSAFHTDLAHHGLAKNTLIVVYSEFGRAVFENASLGTDHGTAGPAFVIGDRVVGGLVGQHPSLDPAALSPIGEMVATTDYRDLLGTIAMRWLGADPAPLFPGHATTDLGFIL